ncbi:site-2 protease family protein [soil metagenome]
MRVLEAFKRQFVILRVSDIPVRGDLRWIGVILLMTVVIAGGIGFANAAVSLTLGLATTLIFFASIFLHEFAHAAVARMEGLRVVEIVLHPFGGLTRFRSEPDTPRAEFRIAIAGPAASLLLSLIFASAAVAASSAGLDILAALMYTLAIGNLLIAIFNMFPGYPLDGGRVLRAYLWRSGKDLDEATILTGRCGQAIAAAMVIFGLIIAIVRQDFFTGFWAVLVGLFLYDSARSIIKEVNASEQITVQDVMMLPVAVAPESTVQDFVDNILPMYPRNVFPVARDRQLYGMLLLTEMRAVEPAVWRQTLIREIMRPVTHDHFVETGISLTEARELIRSNGIGAVGVIDSEGKFVGILHGSGNPK